MNFSLEILKIDKNTALVLIKGSNNSFDLPIELLPKDSRPGDILKGNINFSPFDTIKSIKQAESI